MSKHGRLVPIGWSRGDSSSATRGSATVRRILSRTNSATSSLARGSTAVSPKAPRKPGPPCAQRASSSASRSCSDASSAEPVLNDAAMPNRESRIVLRISA